MTDCQKAFEHMEQQFRRGGPIPFYNIAEESPIASLDDEFLKEQWRQDTLGDVPLSDEIVEENDSWIDPELAFLGISGSLRIWGISNTSRS